MIAIIGAGNMGGAIFKGLSKIFPQSTLFIADHDKQKLRLLQAATKVSAKNFSTDPNTILSDAAVVIFAVKPQSFDELCDGFQISLEKKLIISIMAGTSIVKIQEKTKSQKIVRSMPNLPAQIGCGMTGWIATKKVSAPEKKLVQKIFSSLGEAIELRRENEINAITALSGSGPAYFFYLCELMAAKARKLGFSGEQANKIANATFIGAAKLLEKSSLQADGKGLTAEEWRKAVTSKGGTTEAALSHLQTQQFEKIFTEAVDKAKNRAEELSQQ